MAWYSDGLTLIHCKIIGTQPFCYCKNLKLIDCEMIETELAFENPKWKRQSLRKWTVSKIRYQDELQFLM